MSIGSWWDKNVKKPLNNLGGQISGATQKVTDKLGLSTPDLPAGSQPVIDQEKLTDLAQYQGVNRANMTRWGQNVPGGPGYYTAENYTPVQSRQVATPTAQAETPLSYTPQAAVAPMEQSLAPLALERYGRQNVSLANEKQMANNALPMEGQTALGLGKVSGLNPNSAQYQTAAQTALNERMNANAPTVEGYDPARKALAMQEMTAGLDTQAADAMAKMTEQLTRAGILNSSAGQAQLAKLKQGYDQQKTNALTQVNLEDLAAARTDRYANADQASARMSQISNLASSGQGMGQSAAGFNANLTAQDNQAIQAEASNLMTQRGIDRETAMQIATFNRQGNQVNNQNALTQEGLTRGAVDQNNTAATNEAQYGRTGRGIDTQTLNSLAQQNFNNQQTIEGFNRTGRGVNTQEGWNNYNAQNEDAIRRANETNSANMYNIGARGNARQQEADSYQQDLRNLAGNTAGGMYTPESIAANDAYNAKQAAQQANLQNTLGLVNTAATAYTGYNAGIGQGKKPAANVATPPVAMTPAKRAKNLQLNMARRAA